MFDSLNNLLILLCRTISTRKLYFGDHPKVERLMNEFMSNLKSFCSENELEKLFIGIIDNNLVFEGRNLVGPSIVGRQLINFAEKLKCGGISFSKETAPLELKAFLNLTLDLKEPTESIQEARDLLVSKDIYNIEIAHQYIGPAGPMTRDQQAIWEG